MGTVFSPAYFRARRAREGEVDPLEYCGLNIAVHGPNSESWAFTEYGADSVCREPQSLQLGQSNWSWRDGALHVDFNEETKPFFQRMPSALSGHLRFEPGDAQGAVTQLDDEGSHYWHCIAPGGRFELNLNHPEIAVTGSGYHDANWGREGLEEGFRQWNWSRVPLQDGAAVLYDVALRSGPQKRRGWFFGRDGAVQAIEPLHTHLLQSGRWGVCRTTRSGSASTPYIKKTLVDAPFYTRSTLETELQGERRLGVHESVDLDRFCKHWVRFLLPFRMRRVGGRPWC